MTVETIKMSSKGQVVIPLDMRTEINAGEGTLFAAVNIEDTIVLKKITTPSKEDLIKELGLFAKKSKKKLQSKGFTEKDLQAK
ncbi:MAG: AbrB/MazE/SpoVT family DNA-binding domain-containing protein [Nanoarchaeota archaeon]|nr:AbrB/MazE/SpoVT family DNA-binding domain-containing protein [Nanoarchaeota archaeon]MBU1622117.1 AbrB/MazE/SpoVT family DNA-binding domain-containing protein [Nanoarchaeota archaeon]MBU1974157.1 AbrB/MazE/SpoVT family DNA-binding domain-containing protein [Nanoarchaeota archaeon]